MTEWFKLLALASMGWGICFGVQAQGSLQAELNQIEPGSFEIESDNVVIHEKLGGSKTANSEFRSATKLYWAPDFNWPVSLALGIQPTYSDSEWDMPRVLFRLGYFDWMSGALSLNGFTEFYASHDEFDQSLVEPHLVVSLSGKKLQYELDMAPRLSVKGGKSPALGVLGYCQYPFGDEWGLGARVLADYAPGNEFVWLGPSIEMSLGSGMSGFLFYSRDLHSRSAPNNQLMVRLAYAH